MNWRDRPVLVTGATGLLGWESRWTRHDALAKTAAWYRAYLKEPAHANA